MDGETVQLADLYRDRTLAIFWNPECSFCQQMLPDLKALERDPPAGAPRLLVIGTGSAERVRADGLRSRVVLDPRSEARTAFDASGTPMAVLVEDGRIASPVAAGAAAVLQLAGVEEMPRIVHAGGNGRAR
jgi:thiol-disulfide isomerase/thioredoxin